MIRKPENLFLLILLFFLAAQLPFLQADPHPLVSPYSRDAFTDEGLNTSQVTNKVNHGYWGVNECDNLIKTPLFSIWLFPAYTLFGTTILAGRLWVLLGCLLLMVFISRNQKIPSSVLILAIFTVLLQYHVFQYLRFTMAEATASLLSLSGLACILHYARNGQFRFVLGSGVFLWAAVFTKNQFAYVLPLLPGWLLIIHLVDKTLWTKKTFVRLLYSAGILFIGGIIYYLLWYIPVREVYDYVMADQADSRFIPFNQLNPMATEHAKEFLFSPHNKAFTWFCLASIPVFILNLILSKDKTFILLSLTLLLWAVFELHKFAMWFVPSRYLLPTLIVWGLFATSQFFWAIRNALTGKPVPQVVAVLFSGLFLWVSVQHISVYIKLHKERSFSILETNRYLKGLSLENHTVAGPWAPTLARETGAKVIPVWYRYFNDEHPFEKFNPKIIISEKDENDSGGAFKNHGITLQERADSSKNIKVAHYDLVIYFFP